MDTNIVYALKIIKAARAIVWLNSVSRLKHGRAYLDNKYTKITCLCLQGGDERKYDFPEKYKYTL
jgi:hypothetical protein